MQILLVEDNIELGRALADMLSGYGVTLCSSIAEAKKALGGDYALYILDWQLPDGEGVDLCREIRERTGTPILMLTVIDDEDSMVKAFAAGADDYVTKPFMPRVLLARVAALLRRGGGWTRLKTGELVLDADNSTITKNGEPLDLLPAEYKLANALISARGALLTRDKLLWELWDKDEAFVEENTLRVHISRLRKRLGDYNGEPYIVTQRGFGYRWGVKVEEI